MKTSFIIGLAALGVFTALTPDASAGVSIHFSFGSPFPAPIVQVPAPCHPPVVVTAPCPPPVIVHRPVCAPAPVYVAPAPCGPPVVITHGYPGWSGYGHHRGWGHYRR
jgi:hypothetical protein